jgi:hypothetical protein
MVLIDPLLPLANVGFAAANKQKPGAWPGSCA